MHDRAHGWLSIENMAIAHDLNHLTVLSHDQRQPFMSDTWDWPNQQAAYSVKDCGDTAWSKALVAENIVGTTRR